MGYTIGDLMGTLSESGRHGDILPVWNAYELAKRAHGRQRRRDGNPYISHPVAVAGLVEDLTLGVVRTQAPDDPELTLITLADRLHNLRTVRPLPAASRRRSSLDTLVFHVPLAHSLQAPEIAAEMTELACATLNTLDSPGVREHRRRMIRAIRRADPRSAAEVVAAFGGGAALISSGLVPEWALVSGGAGALALLTAALFSRDPRAVERLVSLLRARRLD